MSSLKREPGNAARIRARRSLAQIPHRSAVGIDKENMTTDLNAVLKQTTGAHGNYGKDKRSRSKSLGPGGLDALKDGGGNRRKSTAVAPLKSILKPTIPVSPISHIPTFAETRRKIPKRGAFGIPRNTSNSNELLIDFSVPSSAPVSGMNNLANPFETSNAISGSRVEIVSDAAIREKQERERREKEKKTILEQRAARRKSMANRRVSFAPEATLHTWNVVELIEDSTSPASANSTRRASPLTAAAMEPHSVSDPSNKRPDSHKPSRSELEDTGDEIFSSSPFSGSEVAENDDIGILSGNPDDDDESMSSDLDGDNTAMSLENITERSISLSPGSTTSSNGRLDRSLRLAAEIAGTRGIDHDENANLSLEFTNHEIVGAFQPWLKKGASADFDADNLSSRLDQENAAPANRSRQSPSDTVSDDGGDMSMEITKSTGGIVQRGGGIPLAQNNNSDYMDSRERFDRLRRTSTVTSNYGDQTMEFTNVVGGIGTPESPSKLSDLESDDNNDEDMTMEFTTVLGDVISNPNHEGANPHRHNYQESASYNNDFGNEEMDEFEEEEMEMTGAFGRILAPIEEQTEPPEDGTMGMEMTHALGKILAPFHASQQRADDDEPPSSPFQENIVASPPKPPSSPTRVAASENGSPVRSRTRRSMDSRQSMSPIKPHSRQPPPLIVPSTPPKSRRPRSSGSSAPVTPTGSPVRQLRSLSPKKTSPSKKTPVSLFHKNTQNGQTTPVFVFEASRSSSGVGINREGLGSPRVAEILDRRRSIGEDAQAFVLQPSTARGVRFEDPRKLNQEIEQEIRSGSREANQQDRETDVSLNIRDIISSLTPKKNKLRGRKSLHVGAARGLLGKRPIELDEEYEEDQTPKRLKGRERSPVKSIKLPAPPSKAETVGRASHLSMRPVATPSPLNQTISTPKQANQNTEFVKYPSLEPNPGDGQPQKLLEKKQNSEPIKLSKFLEMTNIHFMELTTTKRRHTLAPGSGNKTGEDRLDTKKIFNFEDRVVAGFCTVPMLELYQHSCRELKSYISEGRSIIRSIEAETYTENPPLFQEYIKASPDIKLLMDNQFRNVKTHARLLSKSMWYEWRMKLLEGLKQGLESHVDEMKEDELILLKKQDLLAGVVPGLVDRHAELEAESINLQKVVEDIERCDQDELRRAREKLSNVETELATQQQQLEQAQEDLSQSNKAFDVGLAHKDALLQQIAEAESIREECHGWTRKEICKLQNSVHSLEQQTGWAIVSAPHAPNSKRPDVSILRYAEELQVEFQHSILHGQKSKPTNFLPVAVRYSPGRCGSVTSPSKQPPEIALFLHAMRARLSQLTCIPDSPKPILHSIASTWKRSQLLREEIRLLGYCGVTHSQAIEPNISEPTLLKVRCMLLGHMNNTASPSSGSGMHQKFEEKMKAQARVDVEFNIKLKMMNVTADDASNLGIDVDVDVDVSAISIYGFGNTKSVKMSDSQMSDFLANSIHQKSQLQVTFGRGLWKSAVNALEKNIFG
ncbi:hypothetical protein FQN57_005315 [Myotisia sp. PD_48]|nr:hypothetical protein FQN57_005315 [Myotisia sp. PD_48]